MARAGDAAASTAAPLGGPVSGFRHEALLYSGAAGFLAGTIPFLRQAAAAGDPVLIMVTAAKTRLLRRELGPAAAQMSFAGPARNPARLLAVWRAFARAHAGALRLRGIGEAAGPGRSAAELAEWHRHEALLNVAFDSGAPPFWLLCPYDRQALAAGVIEEARRTHPFLAGGGPRPPGGAFRPVDLSGPFARPLPPRPAGAACVPIRPGGFQAVRAFTAAQAQQAGLASESAADLVLAVHEIAVNSVRHGGGHGDLRAWTEDRWLVCEVSDQGHLTDPLAGRLPPALDGSGGAGLWTASQACDLLQIHSSRAGTVIRLSQHL
jgi:anti-sigma regulatory factor (Ser/Thr protein kinase)